MSFRSYIKVGKRAEYEGRYTSRINPTIGSGDGSGSGGGIGGGGDVDLSDYVTSDEFAADQARQDDELVVDQKRQDDKVAADQARQDAAIDGVIADIGKSADPDDNSVTYRFVTHTDLAGDQNRQDTETKGLIDEAVDSLQQEIIVLEEEIDAITPSVERGKWTFTAVGTVGQPGQFTMYDEIFGNGNPTGLFKSAKSIWFNEIDSAGAPHAFGDVDDGELIEIFIDGSSDFGLYEVVGKAHDETQGANSFWVIDVNFIRTNTATAAIGPGELCRFKFFMPPTGGVASAFVLKSGDQMTGNLTIDRTTDGSTDVESSLTIEGSRPSSTNAAASIKFINDQTTTTGFLTYRSGSNGNWFAFNRDLDLNNNGLHTVAQIRLKPGGYIGSGNNPRLTVNNASTGQEGEGLLVVPRPSDNRRGFVIRGRNADGTEQDMLYTYTNYSGTSDAINYHGKMDSGQNLVNKGYVDAVASPTVVLIGTTCNWKKGGLDDTTLERQYFGIERANSTTSQVGYGSVVYLNKLIAIDGTLQPLKNYTPTDGSLIEVWSGNELWFKSLLDPTTYKVAQRNPNEIVCDCTSYYPIVSKPSTNWSGSTYYKIILTGMKYTG